MKEDRDECLAAGMDAYLAKSVTLEALDVMFRNWQPVDDSESESKSG